jgi:uncharacterized membrane protein
MISLEYAKYRDIGPAIVLRINTKKFAFCLCHRKKDRTIEFFGLENYLCARCLGIFFGIISGAIMSIFFQSISYVFITLMVIPLIIDGSTQSLELRTSSNPLRLVTGVMFGVGFTLLIFCASL